MSLKVVDMVAVGLEEVRFVNASFLIVRAREVHALLSHRRSRLSTAVCVGHRTVFSSHFGNTDQRTAEVRILVSDRLQEAHPGFLLD